MHDIINFYKVDNTVIIIKKWINNLKNTECYI